MIITSNDGHLGVEEINFFLNLIELDINLLESGNFGAQIYYTRSHAVDIHKVDNCF